MIWNFFYFSNSNICFFVFSDEFKGYNTKDLKLADTNSAKYGFFVDFIEECLVFENTMPKLHIKTGFLICYLKAHEARLIKPEPKQI